MIGTGKLVRALALVLCLAGPGAAAPYYVVDLEDARLAPEALHEADKRFAVTLEGTGQAQRRLDADRGSHVLSLQAGPTPEGAGHDRAELRLYGNVTFDRDWFVGLSVFIPRNVPVPQNWQVLLQCHQNGTSLSPPVSLDLEPDGQLALVARDDADPFDTLWSAPMPRGQWVRIVLGLRLGEQGRLRLWIDGKRQADLRRPLGWKAGDRACAIKTGIYRGKSSLPFAVLLDDILLGDTRADVRPR